MASPAKDRTRAERLAQLAALSAATMGKDGLSEPEIEALLDRVDDATKRLVELALAEQPKLPQQPS